MTRIFIYTLLVFVYLSTATSSIKKSNWPSFILTFIFWLGTNLSSEHINHQNLCFYFLKRPPSPLVHVWGYFSLWRLTLKNSSVHTDNSQYKSTSVTGVFLPLTSQQDMFFFIVYFRWRMSSKTAPNTHSLTKPAWIFFSPSRASHVGLLRLQIQRRLQLHPATRAKAVFWLGAQTRLRLQQHVHEAVWPVEGADAEISQSSEPGR